MYSNVIRKEKLAAYERLRMADFARGGSSAGAEVALPTVAELEQIRDAAQAEGFAAGVQRGRQHVESQAAQLRALVESMTQALASVDHEVAQQLLQLALSCARKISGHALQVRPELVLDSIRDAIAELPAFKGALTLRLHPQDVELARASLDALAPGKSVMLQADATLQRGGCKLQTSESAVDASIETRWERVVGALSLEAEGQA